MRRGQNFGDTRAPTSWCVAALAAMGLWWLADLTTANPMVAAVLATGGRTVEFRP